MSDVTVLLVEPDARVQSSITRALDHHGATVHARQSRREGAELLAGVQVQLVITSVTELDDPTESLALLQVARDLCPQALRALMAGRESERIAAARREGLVEQLLVKPFGMSEVAALVEAARAR